MNGKIKNAFSDIHADTSLKKKTYLNITAKKKKNYKPIFILSPALAALLILIGLLYYTPVAYISIDINPSIELEINTFDRIISVNAINDDAKQIISSVDIIHKDYIEALESLENSNDFNEYTDNYTEITVVAGSESDSSAIISDISNCSFYHESVESYSENEDLREEAELYDISFGKYRAYLELIAVHPEITVEDISYLSMNEIRSLIENVDENSYIGSEIDDYLHSGNGEQNDNGTQQGDGIQSGNGSQQGDYGSQSGNSSQQSDGTQAGNGSQNGGGSQNGNSGQGTGKQNGK